MSSMANALHKTTVTGLLLITAFGCGSVGQQIYDLNKKKHKLNTRQSELTKAGLIPGDKVKAKEYIASLSEDERELFHNEDISVLKKTFPTNNF